MVEKQLCHRQVPLRRRALQRNPARLIDFVAADDALAFVGVEAEIEEQLQHVEASVLDGRGQETVAVRRMRERSRRVLRTDPVGFAEGDRRRCRQRGAALQQDVRQGHRWCVEAELERLSERLGGIRTFIGIEAEIEQQRQHLGTIEAYRERHEAADVAHRIGEPPFGMARAEPVALVHRHGPERGRFGAMAQEQIAQLLEAIVRVSGRPAAEHVDRREPGSRSPR